MRVALIISGPGGGVTQGKDISGDRHTTGIEDR